MPASWHTQLRRAKGASSNREGKATKSGKAASAASLADNSTHTEQQRGPAVRAGTRLEALSASVPECSPLRKLGSLKSISLIPIGSNYRPMSVFITTIICPLYCSFRTLLAARKIPRKFQRCLMRWFSFSLLRLKIVVTQLITLTLS